MCSVWLCVSSLHGCLNLCSDKWFSPKCTVCGPTPKDSACVCVLMQEGFKLRGSCCLSVLGACKALIIADRATGGLHAVNDSNCTSLAGLSHVIILACINSLLAEASLQS